MPPSSAPNGACTFFLFLGASIWFWVSQKGHRNSTKLKSYQTFVQTWQVKEKGKEKCLWEASGGACEAGCVAPRTTHTPGMYLPTGGWGTLPLREFGVLEPPFDPQTPKVLHDNCSFRPFLTPAEFWSCLPKATSWTTRLCTVPPRGHFQSPVRHPGPAS